MIIVNQDKDQMFNFENVIYITVNYLNKVVATTNWNDNADGAYELGKYKTEERAKEVLQDIISRYEAIQLTKMSNKDYGYTLQDYTLVYEMPKE